MKATLHTPHRSPISIYPSLYEYIEPSQNFQRYKRTRPHIQMEIILFLGNSKIQKKSFNATRIPRSSEIIKQKHMYHIPIARLKAQTYMVNSMLRSKSTADHYFPYKECSSFAVKV